MAMVGKTVILATILASLIGCAATRYEPKPNPSPQTKFVIIGQKDPGVEAHFKIQYVADNEECRIDRPYEMGVSRTVTDDRLSFAEGIDEFSIEFILDKYLRGDCQWHAQSLDVSVNRPPYNAFSASWTTIASFDLGGTQGLEDVELTCLPIKPTSRAMWCKNPIANIWDFPGQAGQLRVRIVLDVRAQ